MRDDMETGCLRDYVDEFDAFEKFYRKYGSRALHKNDFLEEERCECSPNARNVTVTPDQLTIETPNTTLTNKDIEFAHSSLKLVENDIKGRHLLAKSDLKSGELLINEKAAVLQVDPTCLCFDSDARTYRCHHCAFPLESFYTCSNCNIVMYCSVDCTVQSYNEYHKFECEAFQTHFWALSDTNFTYLAFRMIMYAARYNFNYEIPKNYKKWGTDGNNYPFIYRLQTNFKELTSANVLAILEYATATVKYLKERTDFFSLFEVEEDNSDTLYYFVGGLFVKHYCQAQVNCVHLKYPNFGMNYTLTAWSGTGKAICPTVALLNHSCSPNAVIIPCNDRVLVKAITPIRTGEEITISYSEINPFFPLHERQLIMKYYFFFRTMCECAMCTYESSWKDYPYKCPKCDIGLSKRILVKDEVKQQCNACEVIVDCDLTIDKQVEEILSKYHSTFSPDPLVKLVECYSGLFPWDSWKFLDLYLVLYNKSYSLSEKPLETIKYGMLYFSILEQYIPRLHHEVLNAKLNFVGAIINNEYFSLLDKVTAEEYDIIEKFWDQCRQIENNMTVYAPKHCVQFYTDVIASKSNKVKKKLRVLRKGPTKNRSRPKHT